MKKVFIAILSVLFILIIYLHYFTENNATQQLKTSNTYVIGKDTNVQWEIANVPIPETIYSEPEIIMIPPDSNCIAEWINLYSNYSQTLVYSDTLKDDSSALVIVVDTILKNKLYGRSFGFMNRRATEIIINNYTTIVRNDNGLYVGGGFVGNKFGGEVSVIRNRFEFDIGTYDKEVKFAVKYRLLKF